MEKYFFTKDVNLGIVRVSAKRGDVVIKGKDYYQIANQKYTTVRDFEIAIQHGWLVKEQVFRLTKAVEKNEVKHNFGFKIQKEQGQKTISVSNFQATVLNQQQGFVQEDGEIKNIVESDVHVVSNVAKIAQKQQDEVKQQQHNDDLEKIAQKKAVQKKTEAKTKQTTKNTKKVSKVAKNVQIKQQKVEGQVRGMKIIKGE